MRPSLLKSSGYTTEHDFGLIRMPVRRFGERSSVRRHSDILELNRRHHSKVDHNLLIGFRNENASGQLVRISCSPQFVIDARIEMEELAASADVSEQC